MRHRLLRKDSWRGLPAAREARRLDQSDTPCAIGCIRPDNPETVYRCSSDLARWPCEMQSGLAGLMAAAAELVSSDRDRHNLAARWRLADGSLRGPSRFGMPLARRAALSLALIPGARLRSRAYNSAVGRYSSLQPSCHPGQASTPAWRGIASKGWLMTPRWKRREAWSPSARFEI